MDQMNRYCSIFIVSSVIFFFPLERFSSIKIKLEIREVVLKDEC